MSKRISVLIADDHPIVCKGIYHELSAMDFDIDAHIITESQKIWSYLLEEVPDVAIIDIDMTPVNGIEIAKKLFETKHSTKIILLTFHKDKAFFLKAMEYQVAGFLQKDALSSELKHCITEVLQGNSYVGKTVFERLEDRLVYLEMFSKTKYQLHSLTQSEKNILKLISQGKTSQEISKLLFISYKTVENHRSNISKKLEISGYNALFRWANEHKVFIEFLE